MADIRGITAQIGGGKSFFGTIEICKELESSDRLIMTDIPLILDNPPQEFGADWTINEYCHKFIKRPINVQARLCVMSQEQAGEFWRYLPAAAFDDLENLEVVEHRWAHGVSRMVKLPNITHKIFKEVPDFSFRTKKAQNRIGCHYVIDEAHKKFPPMFYQRVGAQAEWYMSELRKLNDDLDWITQHPEKVDKNFRRDCTEWLHVQNMSRASLFMGVSFKNRFRYHYFNQPEMPTRSDKPTASGWFKFDPAKRYHHLYKTMDGTGVSGGLLKENSRHKGKHPIVWVLALIAIFAIAYFLPRAIEKAVKVGVGGLLTGVQKGAQGAMEQNIPKPAVVKPVQTMPTILPVQVNPNAMTVKPQHRQVMVSPFGSSLDGQLYCTGWVRTKQDIYVMLSDGRTLSAGEGEVQDVGQRFVKILGGQIIPVKK